MGIVPHSTTITTPPNSNNMTVQCQEMYETIDILAGGIQTLNEDVQHLSTESLILQNGTDALNRGMAELKLSIEEEGIFLNGIKPNQEILHQDVASLKQQ
ncbi:unnamed protein product, partial [Rotaria sp. Silwood2]